MGSSEIDILIGTDFYWEIDMTEIITAPSGLRCINSRLGWLLHGNSSKRAKRKSVRAATMILNASAEEKCEFEAEEEFDLAAFHSLDALGVTEDGTIEPKPLVYFEQEITRNEDVRYQVSLPWKPDHGRVSPNQETAEAIVGSLVKRLERKDQLQEYHQQIMDYVKQGFVSEAEPNFTGIHTYLGRFPVATLRRSELLRGVVCIPMGPSRAILSAEAFSTEILLCCEHYSQQLFRLLFARAILAQVVFLLRAGSLKI